MGTAIVIGQPMKFPLLILFIIHPPIVVQIPAQSHLTESAIFSEENNFATGCQKKRRKKKELPLTCLLFCAGQREGDGGFNYERHVIKHHETQIRKDR